MSKKTERPKRKPYALGFAGARHLLIWHANKLRRLSALKPLGDEDIEEQLQAIESLVGLIREMTETTPAT